MSSRAVVLLLCLFVSMLLKQFAFFVDEQILEMKKILKKPYVATTRTANQASAARCIQCHEVAIIVHLVDTEDGDSMDTKITSSVLQHELKILNDAFAASAFKFTLKETNNIVNGTLALSNPFPDTPEGAAIKKALGEYRTGGPDVCNVFYSKGTCEGVLGFASSPSGYFMYPDGEYLKTHTVFICSDQITTDSLAEDGRFKTTLIREVGHWMGLVSSSSL